MSCSFMSCYLIRHFHVLHFPRRESEVHISADNAEDELKCIGRTAHV